jgi:putative acyl-CoA dehydrogenase
MCDAFLVLAQAGRARSLPRFLPDGSLNALRLQRLKDKLGNRSNASPRSSSGRARLADRRRYAAFQHHQMAPARGWTAPSARPADAAGARQRRHHCRRTVFQKKLVGSR